MDFLLPPSLLVVALHWPHCTFKVQCTWAGKGIVFLSFDWLTISSTVYTSNSYGKKYKYIGGLELGQNKAYCISHTHN
uniref:Uncharacterized protein n=1 Tax=Arundo donax TaxID=35708 RepID=A0A0A8Z061_ARUDO